MLEDRNIHPNYQGETTMANVLQSLSDDMVAAVETAGQSIVRVEGRRRMSASGIVWSADGVIVSAHHVVTRDEDLTVGLPNGDETSATLVGRDPSTDLVVLRANASGLKVPVWVESDALRVGQLVLALGRPGRTVQATLGVVSAVGASWRTGAGGQIDRYLQTDVVMYPGFSGGPLVGASGAVLGLNSSALLQGVSVTIPTGTLKSVVGTLLEHGHMRRGYLGVGAQPVRLPDALAQQLDQETALLLVSVEADSPAAKSGLVMGDTIVAFDGEPVRHMDDLQALLGGDRVGKSFPMRIIRGGDLREIKVTVGERE
jgi:S1-C subfamily serine protease